MSFLECVIASVQRYFPRQTNHHEIEPFKELDEELLCPLLFPGRSECLSLFTQSRWPVIHQELVKVRKGHKYLHIDWRKLSSKFEQEEC